VTDLTNIFGECNCVKAEHCCQRTPNANAIKRCAVDPMKIATTPKSETLARTNQFSNKNDIDDNVSISRFGGRFGKWFRGQCQPSFNRSQ
jgi:hypothetical protein